MSPFLYKWLKLSLVSLVACGFIAMAIYALIKREDIKAAQLEPPLIEVPGQALKTRPESPGGLEFPNQDKLVFDLLEGTAASPADDVTTTAGNALVNTVAGAAAASSFAMAPTPVTATTPSASAPVTAAVADTSSPTLKSVPAAKPLPPVAEAAATTPAQVKLVATPVKAAGSWSVQLAAVASEADARTTARQLQGKFKALEPLTVRVVAAPGGQRFRVQFTGLATRNAAQAVCDKLGTQPCFPVGK